MKKTRRETRKNTKSKVIAIMLAIMLMVPMVTAAVVEGIVDYNLVQEASDNSEASAGSAQNIEQRTDYDDNESDWSADCVDEDADLTFDEDILDQNDSLYYLEGLDEEDSKEHEEFYIEIEPLTNIFLGPGSIFWDVMDAFDAAPTDGTEFIIELGTNIDVSMWNFTHVRPGTNIVLIGSYTLTMWGNSAVITVDGTFTLDGPTLTRQAAYSGPGVNVNSGGAFTMNSGTIRNQNNGVNVRPNATFTMNNGVIENNRGMTGAGVNIPLMAPGNATDGRFYMFGGQIINNVATLAGGGGVTSAGTFIMHNGLISGNEALGTGHGGGVNIAGGSASPANFIMHGGTINNNRTTVNHGGGVYIGPFDSFVMNYGTISNNTAGGNWGGGGVASLGQFTMHDGHIFGNTSLTDGGGVSGTLTMINGTIRNNTAVRGGGVAADWNLNITGGLIHNNIATGAGGGGVFVPAFAGNVNIGNATIRDNTALNGNGGGVFSNHSVTVSNTIIRNNTAENGGGVAVSNSTFNMNGGSINNNDASLYGGGIYAFHNGVVNLNSGYIVDNFAQFQGGGIFTERYIYENPLPPIGTPGLYDNLNIYIDDVVIAGNTAGSGIFETPSNYNILPFGHLLNNYQINYVYGGRLVSITFNLNSGNVANNTNDITREMQIGTSVGLANVPNPSLHGYVLTGWRLADTTHTAVQVGELVIAEPVTFVAQWERNPAMWFTVTYAPGTQGAFTEQVFTNIFYGTATPAFVGTPQGNTGWTFVGWEPQVAATVNANVTYVAQWEPIIVETPAEYRNIRIYYYMLENGILERDTDNNPYGRQYTYRVGDTFDLGNVLDRDDLDGDNDYVFEGWLVHVNGMPHQYYIYGKDTNELHGTFVVPAPAILPLMHGFAYSADRNVVGGTISLVAVWSVYEAEEATTDGGQGNQSEEGVLPRTGIENSALLWIALTVLSLFVGLVTVIKLKGVIQKGGLER
ncbi:MAG: hypothetical protein FWD05_07035 [Oscillospiraceae bacterium]|nr:hypothetical protein [Oscillospiraceae bacterium]